MGNLLTRRNFLRQAALAGATLAFANCSVKSNWPGFECEYLSNRGSPLKLVYWPDFHTNYSQTDPKNPNSLLVRMNRVGRWPDLVALEGLSGDLDMAALRVIERSEEHTKHVLADNAKRARSLVELVPDVLPAIASFVVHVQGNPSCCTDVPLYLQSSPGRNFVKPLFDNVRLFGFEDEKLYDSEQEKVMLWFDMNAFDLAKKLEKSIPQSKLKEYRALLNYDMFEKNKRRLYELDGKKSERELDAQDDALVAVRNNIALNNIAKRQPYGEVWMIMGEDHKMGIIDECDRRGISLAIPK